MEKASAISQASWKVLSSLAALAEQAKFAKLLMTAREVDALSTRLSQSDKTTYH